MKRSHVLLSSVATILVVAMFWMFAFQPQREALAEVEDRIAAEVSMQQQLQAEIDRLRHVRAEAPEIEATLAAAQAIVPRDSALPASLRQMQEAADEAGVVLQAVTTGRPAQVEGGVEGLSSISVNVSLVGGYFQVIDFLRRLEDPSITARGLIWSNASLAIDEYPQLNVNLTGELYAAFDVPPPPEPEPTPPVEGEEAEGDDANGDDVTDETPVEQTEADSVAMEEDR